nr:class I SAM-dependent methyltransferase [Candidatus Sigynarchaeota archaeon]
MADVATISNGIKENRKINNDIKNNPKIINAIETTASIFNGIKDIYDDVNDLWYSWLFSRLHYFIADTLGTEGNPARVLDAGCGTGFQSYLHAAAGSEVIGVDVAKDLLAIAEAKKKTFDPVKCELFPVYFSFVKKYNLIIQKLVTKLRDNRIYKQPTFQQGNIAKMDFEDRSFDHVNCCGSTLSFVPRFRFAIAEFSRVLKDRGTFFIETDTRWNFDAAWTIIDPFLHGKLGINDDFKGIRPVVLKNPLQNVWINFKFREKEQPVNMPLDLFTESALAAELRRAGLRVEKRWSINSITNIIPSTFLDTTKPSKRLVAWYTFLTGLEERLPMYAPGCSIVLFGRKISK